MYVLIDISHPSPGRAHDTANKAAAIMRDILAAEPGGAGNFRIGFLSFGADLRQFHESRPSGPIPLIPEAVEHTRLGRLLEIPNQILRKMRHPAFPLHRHAPLLFIVGEGQIDDIERFERALDQVWEREAGKIVGSYPHVGQGDLVRHISQSMDPVADLNKARYAREFPVDPPIEKAEGQAPPDDHPGWPFALGDKDRKPAALPNAVAGVPYQFRFHPGFRQEFDIAGERPPGLEFDSGTGVLSGIPQGDGKHEITFRWHDPKAVFGSRVREESATLTINPDPKSLWVSKSPDPDAPFQKKNAEAFRVEGPDMIIAAASVRGRSHAHAGTFRDDDSRIFTEGPWSVAVVADGAGSAEFSRRGSEVAVNTFAEHAGPLLREKLDGPLDGIEPGNSERRPDGKIRTGIYGSLVMSAFEAARAVEHEAKKHGKRSGEFSTTLVAAAARKTSVGWFTAGFSIGDGGAAVLGPGGGEAVTLTKADSGTHAGETRFLTTGEFKDTNAVMDRIHHAFTPNPAAVVVMTDGVTDPKFPTDSDFLNPESWVKFWNADLGREVVLHPGNHGIHEQLLAWLDFWSKGNHDDRTVAIMLPRK